MATVDAHIFLSNIRSTLTNIPDQLVTSIMQSISNELNHYNITSKEPFNQTINSEELINLFISAKSIEGKSPKTLDQYVYRINHMLKFSNTPIQNITVYHIRNYLNSEKQRGISDRTIEGYRDIFSSFFGWLHREGLISSNPISNISVIKCIKKVRKPLSDIDIERLKESCKSDRDRAILFFLLSTGCRVSEACGINITDLNLQKLECKITGKGKKERIVYFNELTAMMLTRYLDSRLDQSPALFAGKGSDRLTPSGIRYMLNKVANRAGVDNVHPHRMRRTFTTNMINHGMSIQDVARILGHEKIDTTLKYYAFDQENIKNSYRKYA